VTNDRPQPATDHPQADAIEEYVMGVRLDDATRSAMTAHFAVCRGCRDLCAETEIFVGAMREVLSRRSAAGR
jgi:hypothetical protein